jgi:hypothetical protein
MQVSGHASCAHASKPIPINPPRRPVCLMRMAVESPGTTDSNGTCMGEAGGCMKVSPHRAHSLRLRDEEEETREVTPDNANTLSRTGGYVGCSPP